jgi:hypothetical protein
VSIWSLRCEERLELEIGLARQTPSYVTRWPLGGRAVYLLFQLQLQHSPQTRQNAISEQRSQLLFLLNRWNSSVKPSINKGKYLRSWFQFQRNLQSYKCGNQAVKLQGFHFGEQTKLFYEDTSFRTTGFDSHSRRDQWTVKWTTCFLFVLLSSLHFARGPIFWSWAQLLSQALWLGSAPTDLGNPAHAPYLMMDARLWAPLGSSARWVRYFMTLSKVNVK